MLIVKREISIGVELWAVFTAVGAASTLAEIAISGLRCSSALKANSPLLAQSGLVLIGLNILCWR
jgi:hypothetical protein